MSYKTYEWKFKSKKPKATFLVYARSEKTAKEIVDIANTESMFFLKPARFRYKTEVSVIIPPYELELEQMEAVERRLENRRKHLSEHPEHRSWLSKPEKHRVLP